jgi:sec-independent protein translocase protein TatA
MEIFQPWHLLIVAGIAILLFGGKKLPELGKGLGEGLRGFKEGMKGLSEEESADIRRKEEEQNVRADLEAKAYQEAKMAAEAKAAAEARVAAELKARENEVVIK